MIAFSAGLAKARVLVLNGSPWKRCRVHFMRNVLSRVSKAAVECVSATVQHIFMQPDHESAVTAFDQAVALLRSKYPAAAAIFENTGQSAAMRNRSCFRQPLGRRVPRRA